MILHTMLQRCCFNSGHPKLKVQIKRFTHHENRNCLKHISKQFCSELCASNLAQENSVSRAISKINGLKMFQEKSWNDESGSGDELLPLPSRRDSLRTHQCQGRPREQSFSCYYWRNSENLQRCTTENTWKHPKLFSHRFHISLFERPGLRGIHKSPPDSPDCQAIATVFPSTKMLKGETNNNNMKQVTSAKVKQVWTIFNTDTLNEP